MNSAHSAVRNQMIVRFIQFARAEQPARDETAAEARVRLADRFPRTSLRRMTHLGLLAGSTFDGIPLGPDDAVVYASTFAETRALEDYLTSFPAASPMLFQTSIHPSAMQQVLIGRQQPIRRFWPLTGRVRLAESALMTALLETAPRTILVGGEERGTWLLEHAMASSRAFAFSLVLTVDPAGALGSVAFTESPGAVEGPAPTLEAMADAIAARQALMWNGAGGTWNLAWLP